MIIDQLNNKIQNIENGSYAKIENFNNEINLLKQNLTENVKELKYYKDSFEEEQKNSKKLQIEINRMKKVLEDEKNEKLELKEKLFQQSNANKEILSSIEQELVSRAESLKSIKLPKKSKNYMSLEEEDLLEIYGRP